ncbi:hypothetical protein LTR67_008544 [Exophiala xenobiotica]
MADFDSLTEMDSLLDSLMQRRKAVEVSYIDDKDAEKLQIEERPSKGQGVFAKQTLSVKDPICSLSCPTMIAIDSDFLPTTCYQCLVVTATQLPLVQHGLASTGLKDCGGCRSARFCSRECQVEAWHAYHKFECKIFKKLHSEQLPPAILRAVLRAVLLKDRNKMPEDEWDRITSLISHEQILAARGRSNITDMAEGIKHLAESSMSVEEIQKLIFIMKANAIELPSNIHGGIGVMLVPLVGKINHSCEPNLSIHRPQHTMTSRWMSKSAPELSEDERRTFMRIIPLRDIQEGEELLNCYVAPTVSVSARRAKLMDDYLFKCECPRCQSDMKAATDLANEQPALPAQFEQWTKDVGRHLSRVERDSSALQKAAASMDKSERFLDYPTLYTTGDFPEMAMAIILLGLKNQAFDEALVNVLRLYFLVNPVRFVSRHNPTNIYTIFLMLDIFDAVLGLSTPPGITNDKREKWMRNLPDRGLSRSGLIYWRARICADLRKRMEESAMKDLIVLVEKREAQTSDLTGQDQNAKVEEESRDNAEQEMGIVLKLKEARWKAVLQENGC